MKTVQDSESRTEAADLAGHGSKITTEGSFLVLRWGVEEVADVMDSAGLTLEDLLVKHLVPCLESMKTLCFKYRGQIVEKREVPDHDNQLKAAILGLRLFYPESKSTLFLCRVIRCSGRVTYSY